MALANRTRRKLGRPRNPADPAIAARIRALREARGMTQAQLAGEDFTKGFISLIETSRTGISLRAARILANRLGLPVDEMLRPEQAANDRAAELALVRAEAEMARGHHDAALKTARPAEKASPGLRRRYVRLRGRVLLESGRATEAIKVLDEALRAFRTSGERELATRTLFDLVQAHSRAGALGEAAQLALMCESALAAGEAVDASLELRVLEFLAAAFVAMGDLTSADLRIERAKRLAEDIADPRAVGDLYFNLAVARQEMGDAEAALLYGRKALEAFERMGIPQYIGNTWNTVGWIYARRHQFARAREALDRAQRIAREAGDGGLEAYVLQSRAEMALAEGDADAAMRFADQSAEHPHASPRCRALSLLVRAQALATTKASIARVNEAFADAVEALGPHGPGLIARAHRAHFEALSARGAMREATEAARAAFAASPPTIA
jgi:tetratricopeptide (TPR) repeat protein